MTTDLISRSALLSKAIRVTETDEGGWERTLRAVPVEDIEAAEAVQSNAISREALLAYFKAMEERARRRLFNDRVADVWAAAYDAVREAE